MSMSKDQETKMWAAKEFGIPEDQIVAYNAGICYSRIWVTTKEAADKVSAKVAGKTVNGGMFHGMPLGNQGFSGGTYDVMC